MIVIEVDSYEFNKSPPACAARKCYAHIGGQQWEEERAAAAATAAAATALTHSTGIHE